MRSRQTLDRGTVKEIERFLKDKRAELRESVRRAMAEPCTNEGGQPADPLERASDKTYDDIQRALLDCHRRRVAQIEAALRRLARGEYGVCQACGGAIGLARLRALPFAQRCAPCQARAERQGRPSPERMAPVMAAADGA